MKKANKSKSTSLENSPSYLALLRKAVVSPTLDAEVKRMVDMCRVLVGETAKMDEEHFASQVREVLDSLGRWNKANISHADMQARKELLLSLSFDLQHPPEEEDDDLIGSDTFMVRSDKFAILTPRLREFGMMVLVSLPHTLYPELILFSPPEGFIQLSLERWLHMRIVSLTSDSKAGQSFDLSEEFMIDHYLDQEQFAAVVADPDFQFDPDAGLWSRRPTLKVWA